MLIPIAMLAASAWSALPPQQTVAPAAPSPREIRNTEIPADAQRTTIRVQAAAAGSQEVSTIVNGQNVTLQLAPWSLRSPNFEVLTQAADGVLRRLDTPPPASTYRGVVREWDCTTVTGSLTNGRLTALVRSLDHGDWLIQPAAPDAAGDHVVFRAENALPHDGVCGVTPEMEAAAAARRVPLEANNEGEGNDAFRGGTYDTEISIDSDVEFFVLNGSSVPATVDDIETVMIGIDAIYRAEVGIQYVVNRIIVRTAEPDPYDQFDSTALLEQFRANWENNHGGQERDTAHLFSGKDFSDGNVIGRAYLAEICNREDDGQGGYGISQSRFSSNMASRMAVTAHELGHNWAANHCIGAGDCAIMCSNIGGCSGVLNQFGVGETNEIVAHRNSRTCLGGFNNTVYVNAAYSGSEEGSPGQPYNTLREGLWATGAGGTIVLSPGNYDWDRTASILNRPVTLTKLAVAGTVLIGQ